MAQTMQDSSPAQRLRNASTPVKIGIGCLALVLACGICAGASALVGGFGHGASTPGNVLQATDTPAAPTATAKPKAWVTVQHFTGTDNTQTATFHVPDGSQIKWSVQAADQYGGTFAITSYNSDGTTGDLIANTSAPPSKNGVYNVHGDLDIYLKVDTFGCSYDIQVLALQ